jgi:hypothetical protein
MRPTTVRDVLLNPGMLLGSNRHILLLSHMRCYTSLLGHIFGSNPEIAGFAELHLPYYTKRDLIRSRYRIATLAGKRLKGKSIYFDKLLHNACHVSVDIMRLRNVNIIVSIRRPEDAISSIINMGKKYHDIGWYQDQFRAVNYYTARLSACCESMARFNDISGRRAIFFQAERLIDNPEDILRSLSKELGLTVPLVETYETYPETGYPGVGDPSEKIMAGHIVQDHESRSHVQFDPVLIDWAQRVYRYSIEVANRTCVVI